MRKNVANQASMFQNAEKYCSGSGLHCILLHFREIFARSAQFCLAILAEEKPPSANPEGQNMRKNMRFFSNPQRGLRKRPKYALNFLESQKYAQNMR